MILEANLHWRYVQTPSNLVMPWYTLPCLQWLIEQNTKSWVVFEYGCGYSTQWWRLNCDRLESIESDGGWAKAMSVRCTEDKEIYICGITGHRTLFDCVIVDGEYREECVEFAMNYISPGGYLIIDNYDSEDHDPKTTDHLLEGWEKKIYKQPNHSTWQTAVFQKPK